LNYKQKCKAFEPARSHRFSFIENLAEKEQIFDSVESVEQIKLVEPMVPIETADHTKTFKTFRTFRTNLQKSSKTFRHFQEQEQPLKTFRNLSKNILQNSSILQKTSFKILPNFKNSRKC